MILDGWILETVDCQSRKVLNILVKPLDSTVKPQLLISKFIDKCDAQSIVEEATSAIKKLGLEFKNLVVLV